MSKRFIVIGMPDVSKAVTLPETLPDAVFSGGRRHHELVKELLPADAKWIDITVPLSDVFAQYAQIEKPIVVFASGDPLFFGFANTIRRKIPDADIEVFPFFNSLQMLAHRLVMPYHDMTIVSLTGRPWHEFDCALIERRQKIGVLTDGEHSPAAIAQRMLEYGYNCYQGLNSEANKHLGIPDNQFALLEGREKMITKAPVRLLTLAALELQNRQSLWDIGFCTGSISIEAKLQFPHLHVTAFEIREEGKQLMDVNSHRFKTPGITSIIADFIEIPIDDCIPPDAVFIGGHGGRLKEMMAKAANALLPGGVMVYNCVDPKSITDERIRTDSQQIFEVTARELGLVLEEPIRVAINDYHPIIILKARKS